MPGTPASDRLVSGDWQSDIIRNLADLVGLRLRVFETRIRRGLRTEWSSSFGTEKDPGAPLS